MSNPFHSLAEIGVIPVIAIDDAAMTLPLADALLEGGIPCAEITFRTAAAAEAIRRMTAACPEMLVGAGTVLTIAQAEQAVAAGAKFIVAPGFDPEVVDWCLARAIPITPGVATPTEVTLALKKGLSVLKFFPAETMGGAKALKAIAAPFGGVKFMPTGGIGPKNLADYLSLPFVLACGGSWMVTPQLIAAGEFDAITRLSREAVDIAQQIRTGAI